MGVANRDRSSDEELTSLRERLRRAHAQGFKRGDIARAARCSASLVSGVASGYFGASKPMRRAILKGLEKLERRERRAETSPPATEPAYPLALSEHREPRAGRTLSAKISIEAELSEPVTAPDEAEALLAAWGMDAIRFVLQEATRTREARP